MSLMLFALLFASQPSAAPVAAPDKPKLICRESEQETGSHIRSGRQCKTAEQWQRFDEARQMVPPSLRVTQGQGDALTKQEPH
jgi:hypothetical protein